MRLWIDDIRIPPDPHWYWAMNSHQAIMFFAELKLLNGVHDLALISYDHDLGGDDTSRKVVLWQCENDVWPQVAQIHSANTVGVDWLHGMVVRYGDIPVRVVHYTGG